MRFSDPHTLLQYFIYVVLGMGGYFLIICSLCRFLAFGEASDGIRSRSVRGVRLITKGEDQHPETHPDQGMGFRESADSHPSAATNKFNRLRFRY
jgi:hypothetical protein